MPKRISAAEASGADTPLRVLVVTMDSHMAGAARRAQTRLARHFPGLRLDVHAASEWGDSAAAVQACVTDIAAADIVIATMLFLEEHFQPVLPALQARQPHCDAMVGLLSAPEVTRLTRMGKYRMDGEPGTAMALLKRLRPKAKSAGTGSVGAQQMKMLRRLPQILRFVPGTAQDLRAWFLAMQYWLGGSDDNIAALVHLLIDRYADGPRRVLRGLAEVPAPIEYPEVGLYHPRLGTTAAQRMSEQADALPRVARSGERGTVGLLLMRSYLLAGNSAHYDGVITALEARGLRVLPAFASGLDNRAAIERYFIRDGRPQIDALLSLTGFSLVGGPAYNDSAAAETVLAQLDVPYLAVTPVEFQSIEQWGASERGLLPVESTMMVAIPELDGATGAMVYGGRAEATGQPCSGCARACRFAADDAHRDMQVCSERADALAARVGRLVDLRRSQRAQRRVGIVIFNFPPNAGNTGTAAFLAVFESLFHTLKAMKAAGYTVDVPADVDTLRNRLLQGNASRFGADANVHQRIAVNDHVKREPWLKEIEVQWGPAPGRQLSDGASLFVLGERFGNVFIGVQPGMGYEGDPMRLLFERGFAPTHAFSAFYRWLREDFKADALLHFGTHGALEFMPGKQTGMSGSCWPDRLIGDMPNFYLYAANNPSEGTVAKRRAAATLISYLTPPVAQAGIYRGLLDLKASVERYRTSAPDAQSERDGLLPLIQAQAADLELGSLEPAWASSEADAQVQRLLQALRELETTLIPHGLHVVGRPPPEPERLDFLRAMAEGLPEPRPNEATLHALAAGLSPARALAASGQEATADLTQALAKLAQSNHWLGEDSELPAILHALDGGFVRPATGGDLLRTPEILPTGRNLHGFDPFRIPSAFAQRDGQRQAQLLLERHLADGHAFPETVALVLWGTDNLKTEGAPMAQALALMGAAARFDAYGRLAGAQLLPLAQLGRPRVDVMVTLSGIFRDLLPLQVRTLAEAAFLAASADEPAEMNFVRKHALAYQAQHGGSLETASLRVFGNAEGAYGANLGSLIDGGRWNDEDELAETFTRRKGFAYGRNGRPMQQAKVLDSVLASVQLAYQNLDSVELGVTTIDTYFDTLGGVSRAVKRAKASRGEAQAANAPVYIGDHTRGDGRVRSLSEQVALETRTRMLNPKWYEGMLAHGYEGVRQIELHLTNTLGWSATTGQVQPWVYHQLTQTFMLDKAMRDRLARLNPSASAKLANRLIEASERRYWSPDPEVLAALKAAGEELEDRLEGIHEGTPA
jgi:magnesium chelatase subunit H